MKIIKEMSFRNLFLIGQFFLICGCQSKQSSDDLGITYSGYKVYLNENHNYDSERPPIFYLNFTIKNLTTEYKVFITKSDKYDDTKSKFYLFDTVKKVEIPLYCSDKSILEPDSNLKIDARIEIKEFKEYFNLPDSFFDKIDFTNDSKKLERDFKAMINRSIIFYKQESSDVYQYKILDSRVKPLKKDEKIRIYKPISIN